MMWNTDWNSWGWGAWCLMAGTMIVITAVAIWLIASITRREQPTTRNDKRPEDILADRFARGEITEDDYRRQRELLHHH